MKKAATVELENELDGTDRGDGRVESVDERWRTMENDGDGERNSGVEDEVGRTDGIGYSATLAAKLIIKLDLTERTEQTTKDWRRTDEDSGR